MEKCCSECSEPRVGHSLCTHCNKWLCFQCTELHLHERTSTSTQPPEHHLHQRANSSSPQAQPDTGSSCCERAVVMCPLHKQETLELLCETCDLMTCSICHLSAHKDHRLVHVGKALQDQRWLLENLMARVEEKRSAVENTAKQIQGRLHGVKITQRKAENQIKMAKMIMMNELNKRTKLLIEQLENVSSSFKKHLEDQLQGAIELCSQLEHVQNFITWAVAHHRRNPLLFSKELIALQMQQLLEPLQFSDTWAPLKVKFNWDASFWTKQISTLGQLSVEGGGRPYSEGTGHTSILRPQPVTCRAVPSLCHSVREADCAYQAFCQPQLCCLHCRAAQSVPLDKYQCPPQPGCSSPPSLQRRWEPEGNAMPPQSLVCSSQLPSSPAGPRQQMAPRPPPTATPMSMATPTVTPTPQCELLQAATDQAAASCRAPGYSQRLQRASTPTPAATPTVMPTPAMAQETLPRGWQQAAELPGQQCVGSGLTPASSQPYFTASQSEGATSPHSEMDTAARACGAGERSRPSPEDRVQSYGSPEEGGRSHGSPEEGGRSHGSPEQVRLMQNDKPAGDGHCLAAVTGEQEHAAQQDCGGDRCARPGSAGAPGPTQKLPPTALTTYKTEPDNVYTYTDNAGFKTSTKSRLSREVQDSSRDVNEASKVPVVCLERLKILVSKPPAPGGPSDDLPDPGLKAEGTVMVALDREITTEGVSSEEVEVCLLPGEAPQLQELCGKELQEQAAPNTPPAPSTEPPPHTDYEGELASHQTEQDLSEPPSGRASDSLLESATDADLGSEAEVESELQAESDRSLESEPRGESDSELESEQPPDSELLAESERELVSDPDSTAEVSLNLDQEGDWEGGPGAESESRAGPSAAAPPPEGPVEMENEDFCAVCLIGGDLLCCDRCPKVFHLACHVPSLLSFPTGDWVCTLCRDVNWPEVEYDSEDTGLPTDAAPSGLSACDQRKCEKLILDIYCNILSAPFHEPVSPLARHYYQIIRRPMDLSVIRGRLRRSSSSHYSCVQELVDDILLMFKNCAKFNYPDSEVAHAGRSLQVFFSTRLGEVFPDLPRSAPQDDTDSEDDEEAAWVPGAFPWPERRDQSHRKRKRRQSLGWRRLHY